MGKHTVDYRNASVLCWYLDDDKESAMAAQDLWPELGILPRIKPTGIL